MADLTAKEFLYMYTLKSVPNSKGWYTFMHYLKELELVISNPDSSHRWKDSFVFVGGRYWRLFTEGDTILVRRLSEVAGRFPNASVLFT